MEGLTRPSVDFGPTWGMELNLNTKENFVGILYHANCPKGIVIYKTEVMSLKFILCKTCAEPVPLNAIKAYLIGAMPLAGF